MKINALTVPADKRATLEERFAARAGLVAQSEGFEWFELLRPVAGTETYLVYTRWRSEEDYERWASSRSFASGHGSSGDRPSGPPAATGSELWGFEVVESEGPAADLG